ncbi:hypothetical protein BS78_01G059400 [Paspalum vaginatum]|nr:hypothetical protein BS78_01G059400 [Paspalum vaginatum]
MAAKLATLITMTVLVMVAVAATISSTHGARTLEPVEHVHAPGSIASSPTMDDVDFDVPSEEEAMTDDPTAPGPDTMDCDDNIAPGPGLVAAFHHPIMYF